MGPPPPPRPQPHKMLARTTTWRRRRPLLRLAIIGIVVAFFTMNPSKIVNADSLNLFTTTTSATFAGDTTALVNVSSDMSAGRYYLDYRLLPILLYNGFVFFSWLIYFI